MTNASELEHFAEAMQGDESIKWELAMGDEIKSLQKNKTLSLTKLLEGKKVLQNRWVYRLKEEPDGSKRYKARLIVKGFQWRQGIDFTEIFSLVVKMTTITVILSIVVVENLYLEQLDVKTAFLHGDLKEEIFMAQLKSFEVQGKENIVCKFHKSLYGLKQTPRQWYKKFNEFMRNSGFHKCEEDHYCNVKKYVDNYIILALYVDDMLIVGANMSEIDKLKKQLSENFEMKDLGLAKKILSMRISRDRSKRILNLSQEKYIEKFLSMFMLEMLKPRIHLLELT